MEREYVNIDEGRIKEDERVYWHEKSSSWFSVFTCFLVFLPILTFVFIWSFNEFGIAGCLIIFSIFFLTYIICSITTLAMGEEYAITDKKVILKKARLRFWFSYDDIYQAKVKRGIVDIIFNRATIKLKVIHTYSRPYDRKIVARKNGFIRMLHIKNHQIAVEILNKLI